MTNDTIDQDVGVTQATVVRLLGYAAVRADLDAARMRIMRTVYLRAYHRCCRKVRISLTALTANHPSGPLGAARTHRWNAQPAG
jgi:hypothetical protein